MDWSAEARRVIGRVHASLPETATIDERKAALFDAYPFGPRQYWPYKAWLKAQKAYLAPFDPRTAPKHLSPLERMMVASGVEPRPC